MIQKLIIACGAISMLFWWAAFGAYSDFVSSLDAVKINGQAIESAAAVSRNDLATLLNYVDCQDCHKPGSELVERLTSSWWSTFRMSPTANFDDVAYNPNLVSENNYYCIAYVGEQWYMAWYPRQTSPFCSGRFCGTNNTTVADFIQVIINILADRIASHYQVNRSSAAAWLSDPAQKDTVQSYFTLTEQATIRREALACTSWSCSLESTDEFYAYLKYCTFNLNACGMQEWQTSKENSWPVAELNVLALEWIISDEEANDLNVEAYVDGRTVLESLSRVKEKVACTFDDDQDKDGIKDYDDSCYLHYNPSQKDRDNDTIGDVCDDDIDGDTVKNPIWIVDEDGNINTRVLSAFTGRNDNCLFDVNTDQWDFNKDAIGDACSESEHFGLTIVTRKIRNGTYALAAQYTWALRNFAWDFGDRSFSQWRAVTHTFPGPGTYPVVLTALWWTRTYIATTTIVVVPDLQAALGFQILPNPLTANIPANIAVTPVTTRPVGSIQWQSNKLTKRWNNGQAISFLYEKQWTYQITAKAYDDAQIVAYAQWSVWINGNIATYLRASNLWPRVSEQVNFTTVTAWIQPKDIASVKWDMGDGTIQTNSLLILPHAYSQQWPKIVTQTIYLLDGTVLANIININVTAPQSTDDEWVDLTPAKLVMQTGEPVRYRFVLKWMEWDNVSRILLDMDDGNDLIFNNTITDGFDYTYITPGIYRIRASVQKTDGKWFYPAAHVTVLWVPLCMQRMPVAWVCDIDNDTIADMCDDDVDGDWVKNILGMIKNNPPACRYTSADIYPDKVQETRDRIKQWDKIDNCFVTINTNQVDLNGNFIGDVCENIIKENSDSDGDGIIDEEDLCPDTPENMNGVEDADGCPEFTDVPQIPAGITPQCNACPCPYVQTDADLQQGDKVRAILLDESGKVRINTSPIELIE